jgi:hypothetical protein
MASRKWVDEWAEQGVRCRLYEKKGRPGVPEYVKCGNDGWPKKMVLTVYVKDEQRPTEAVVHHHRFHELVTFAAAPAGESVDTESEDMNNTLIATVDAATEEQNARCEPDVYSPDGELLNPAPAIEYDVDDIQQEGSE